MAFLLPVLCVLQAASIDVTIARVQALSGALAWDNPALHATGTMAPAAGHRLQVVQIALGPVPIEADVAAFALVSTSGVVFAPVGIGSAVNTMFPLDRLPVGQEVGEILRTDAILSITRRSRSRVTVDAGAGATVALLFDVPEAMTDASLRLPDGRVLPLGR